ncbi:unnamed protein product [Chondrus crispus]|uniref:Uncharacterized protein n=1 Tax=Chondrus crispus TaxID=2769 RepID=R7QM77_CHOCR|nr:unnamed protein product [Chondrus crispus]CDF39204.1 unnamed protein product [Chondrus crispus]|eukprot:XP_005719115.1 unnamed protein product [Chondrus crispus]
MHVGLKSGTVSLQRIVRKDAHASDLMRMAPTKSRKRDVGETLMLYGSYKSGGTFPVTICQRVAVRCSVPTVQQSIIQRACIYSKHLRSKYKYKYKSRRDACRAERSSARDDVAEALPKAQFLRAESGAHRGGSRRSSGGDRCQGRGRGSGEAAEGCMVTGAKMREDAGRLRRERCCRLASQPARALRGLA